MVLVLPTAPGDTPGGVPIIFAASEVGKVIALPTSAGNTPGGTPIAFITSTGGIVEGARGRSEMVSAVVGFGLIGGHGLRRS